MKKKLDLNGLLAKYEGNSQTYSAPYHSPTKDYQQIRNPNMSMERQFYQSQYKNYHPEQVTYVQNLSGNFSMSKSECQQFLYNVKQTLKSEENSLHNFKENAYRQIHERFQAQHEKIRRQILHLLDQAFRNNERIITQQLKRQGNIEPAQFIPVYKRIAGMDQQINMLLHGLKGADYKRSIADTVLRDFKVQIKALQQNIKIAKQNYLISLGQVEPDRQRIQCIRQDLQRLFRINKRAAGVLYQGITSMLRGSTTNKPPQLNHQSQVSTRGKKTIFGF